MAFDCAAIGVAAVVDDGFGATAFWYCCCFAGASCAGCIVCAGYACVLFCCYVIVVAIVEVDIVAVVVIVFVVLLFDSWQGLFFST